MRAENTKKQPNGFSSPLQETLNGKGSEAIPPARHGLRYLNPVLWSKWCLSKLPLGRIRLVYRFFRLVRRYPTLGLLSFVEDAERYFKFASPFSLLNEDVRLRAKLTKEYHKLEKSLVFRDRAPGFAAGVAEGLVNELERYLRHFGYHTVCSTVVTVLNAYIEFQEQHGRPQPALRKSMERCRRLLPSFATLSGGGTLDVKRETFLQQSRQDLHHFFHSRRSVRDFAPEAVADEHIERALEQAKQSPSVCNRQPWFLHDINEPGLIAEALRFQNGNKGFGHLIPRLLLVTGDTRAFFTVRERHQAWVDGGMFSMSLVYALHAQGLVTCCLNLCVDRPMEAGLRDALQLKEFEVPIMMIAVGHPAETYRVAASVRKDNWEILIQHRATKPANGRDNSAPAP